MSKIQRYGGDFPPFARDFQSQERTAFGTEDVGEDGLDANINDDWLRGWGIISPSEFPPIQYFNALGFTLSQTLAYLHQQGVPEWDAEQEYFIGSVTQSGGRVYIARAGTDGTPNVGNDPEADDGTNWRAMPNGISESIEQATDGGADEYASAANTTPPADGYTIRRDFQSANETGTPELDGRTMTDRNGNSLWPGALSGVHGMQYRSGSDTYRVLNPRARLQGGDDIRWYGVNADGATDDSSAIAAALSSAPQSTVTMVEGVYRIGSNLEVPAGKTLVFLPGARLSLASGVRFTVADEATIEAGRDRILEADDTTCEYRILGGGPLKPEWFGVSRNNGASANKTNWDDALLSLYASDPNRAVFPVDFAAGTYESEAPFFLPPRMELHGAGMWSTRISLSGQDEHGLEVCTIESGSIQQDGDMSSSSTYSKVYGMEIDCTGITVTENNRKALAFMPGWSSGVMANVRLNGPSTANVAASLMDGLLLIPTYENGGSGNAAIRNHVHDMRITNVRDGIVVGRFPNTLSGSEPASGGGDMTEGGGAYETYIGPTIYVKGSWNGERLAPRYGCIINRDDNTTRRDRPYSVSVVGNTFDAGVPAGFQGTSITKTNGSATVTGVDTNFTEDINFDGSPILAINFGDGDILRVDEVVSDTEITLLDDATSDLTTDAENVSVRKGYGIRVDSKGTNISVRDNYIDQWGYSILAVSDSREGFYFGNDGAGGPYSQGDDNGTDNFFHHVGSGGVSIRNTPT